jgi:glycosyltransferase involved in cell wall biosynthesis
MWSLSAEFRSEEMSRLYQAADVFVYPSFNETFGLPTQSHDLRRPVVTSDASCMPEIAGGARRSCRTRSDPASIARAILGHDRSGEDRLRDGGSAAPASSHGGRGRARPLMCRPEVAERRRHRQKEYPNHRVQP